MEIYSHSDSILMQEDLNLCCFLCPNADEVLKSLIQHIKENHFEEVMNESVLQVCSCPDAIQLQFKLVSHLLLKSFANDLKTKEIKIEIDPELVTEEYQEPPIEASNGEDFYLRRKRRRRDELEDEEGFSVRCNFCPRLFTKPQSLQYHYDLMHDPTNEFKCNLCTTGHCKTLRNLNAHLRTHQTAEKNCLKCLKQFRSQQQLYQHLRTHQKNFLECDHCEMKFNEKYSLVRHISSHFKDNEKKKRKKIDKEKRTVLCQHCSMWISFYNLKRHIRTSHSTKKNIYSCDFEGCGKSFTENQTLKDHKNLHLGLKPYICEYCSMAFPHIATLRRHKYRHTDPEKYKCETCGECFVTRKSLTNHVQRQHRDVGNDSKPFACDFEGCTSTFKYENYLQNHKRDVHIRKRNRVRGKRRQDNGVELKV